MRPITPIGEASTLGPLTGPLLEHPVDAVALGHVGRTYREHYRPGKLAS